MFFLLVLITTLFVKNNFFREVEVFNYLLAFSLPFGILVFLAALFVFNRYLRKLQDSHRSTFIKLTVLLCLFAASTITFGVLFGIFSNNPASDKSYGLYSLVPYYVSFLIVFGFFVYISPGLYDKINGIPKYQTIMLCIYLLLALVYPLLFVFLIDSSEDGVYDAEKNSAVVFLPFIIVLSINLTLLLPKVLCHLDRKLEFFAVALLLAISIIEFKKASFREEHSAEDQVETKNQDFIANCVIFGLFIVFWILLYCILFIKDEPFEQRKQRARGR